MWDPGQYRQFAAERSRPFRELVNRIRADDPRLVVDLGCGPGELTAELARLWPGADVHGIDSSAEMIEAARAVQAAEPARGGGTLSFELADVRDWAPGRRPDVIVCNAVLQWLPDQLPMVSRWAGQLAPRGWIAIGVPANFDQPAHRLLRELAGSPRWRDALAGARLPRQDDEPASYLDTLATAGCQADVWETTYYQVLDGADPVLRWYLGTALRPVLAALGEADAAGFVAAYRQRLAQAYPAQAFGTVLPFRRVFAVARKES